MKITNVKNLPDTISRAMIKKNASYNSGGVDTSVTQLIQSPRINALRQANFAHLVRDVSEEFYALLGSGVHHILELGATENMIVEERLFLDLDGWKVSGALDVQEIYEDCMDIYDYKVTSAYAITMSDGGMKDDWINQMNLQAMLVRANKTIPVRNIYIIAIIRDFSKAESLRDPSYPQSPILKIQLPLWEYMDQLQYARNRIALHRKASFDMQVGNVLDFCTSDDRWVRDDTYAVLRKGGKRAVRVYDNPMEAIVEQKARGDKYEVQKRAGRSTRCEYCGVSEWCDQYQNTIKPTEE